MPVTVSLSAGVVPDLCTVNANSKVSGVAEKLKTQRFKHADFFEPPFDVRFNDSETSSKRISTFF